MGWTCQHEHTASFEDDKKQNEEQERQIDFASTRELVPKF